MGASGPGKDSGNKLLLSHSRTRLPPPCVVRPPTEESPCDASGESQSQRAKRAPLLPPGWAARVARTPRSHTLCSTDART